VVLNLTVKGSFQSDMAPKRVLWVPNLVPYKIHSKMDKRNRILSAGDVRACTSTLCTWVQNLGSGGVIGACVYVHAWRRAAPVQRVYFFYLVITLTNMKADSLPLLARTIPFPVALTGRHGQRCGSRCRRRLSCLL
jgi:hypothetical protein